MKAQDPQNDPSKDTHAKAHEVLKDRADAHQKAAAYSSRMLRWKVSDRLKKA